MDLITFIQAASLIYIYNGWDVSFTGAGVASAVFTMPPPRLALFGDRCREPGKSWYRAQGCLPDSFEEVPVTQRQRVWQRLRHVWPREGQWAPDPARPPASRASACIPRRAACSLADPRTQPG